MFRPAGCFGVAVLERAEQRHAARVHSERRTLTVSRTAPGGLLAHRRAGKTKSYKYTQYGCEFGHGPDARVSGVGRPTKSKTEPVKGKLYANRRPRERGDRRGDRKENAPGAAGGAWPACNPNGWRCCLGRG